MIKSLSPYYLSIPFVSPLTAEICTSYTLSIYVWDGSKSSPPVSPSYTMTKNNPTSSSGSDTVNIARLVNDFIDFMPATGIATGVINGNNQRWCKTSITYLTADDADIRVVQLEEVQLIVKGYGYGMDGENSSTPINNILLNGVEFKVDRSGVFNLPIMIQETIDASSLVLTSVVLLSGFTYEFSFTSNFSFTQLYYEKRPIGGTTWGLAINFYSTTSPVTANIITPTFEIRLRAFNPLTGNNIYSNIVTV